MAVMLPVGLNYILWSKIKTYNSPVSYIKYQMEKGCKASLVIIYLRNPAIDNASMLDPVPPFTITSASPIECEPMAQAGTAA